MLIIFMYTAKFTSGFSHLQCLQLMFIIFMHLMLIVYCYIYLLFPLAISTAQCILVKIILYLCI